MNILDNELLDNITRQAAESPRLRMNYNLHETLDAKAQRLFNALQPGTALPIHRHTQTAETYILIRGSLRVIFYNDAKEVTESELLDNATGKFGVHIPAGQWHTVEVLEPGTVIFEVKDGPYAPLEDNDMLK